METTERHRERACIGMTSTRRQAERDFIWKLIMGGQGGVGKTTILYRFVHNEFIEDMNLTIGVDFHKKVLERQGYKIELVLWDLGGQEQFKRIHGKYMRGASGGFVCFDLNRRSTLEDSRDWIGMFREQVPGMPILLVGTKYDMIENDRTEFDAVVEDANVVVKEFGLLGMTVTSAKTNFNVDETIHYMVDSILYAAPKAP